MPETHTTVTIHDVLEEFRELATSTRDLGDRFERLIEAYLKTDPIYQDLYRNVWMWNDGTGFLESDS